MHNKTTVSKMLAAAAVAGLVAGVAHNSEAKDHGKHGAKGKAAHGAKHKCKGSNECKGNNKCKGEKKKLKGEGKSEMHKNMHKSKKKGEGDNKCGGAGGCGQSK